MAACAGVKESWSNTLVLFYLLKLREQPQVKLVVDLKAAAIILGIQSARATYVCSTSTF